MRTSIGWVMALVVASVGCKGKDASPSRAGSGVAGSAVAGPPAPDANGNAGSAAAVACAPVSIKLAKAGHSVARDAEQPVTLETMKDALTILAAACVGEVDVIAGDDTDYQTVISAMDAATGAGFTSLGIATPDGKPRPAPKTTPPPDVEAAPLVIVSKEKVWISVGKAAPVEVGEIATIDATGLDVAFAKLARKPDARLLILQADAVTSGKVITAIVAAAKRAGYDDLLFAVKNR